MASGHRAIIRLPQHSLKESRKIGEPTKVVFQNKGVLCRIEWNDDDGQQEVQQIDAELLRVFAPMLRVDRTNYQGGILDDREDLCYRLVPRKQRVSVVSVERMQYGLRLIFSDGYDKSIYTWEDLHEMADNHKVYQEAYLCALKEFNKSRDQL